MEEVVFETTRDADAEALSAFIAKEYSGKEVADENFLDWEYAVNPFGKAVVTLAKAKEKIVSQYAVIPMAVHVQGEQVSGSLSLNTLTDKAFRGKGLFATGAEKTFSRCSDEGINFTYGIPNQHSFPGFVRKLGFKVSGNLIFLAKPLKPVKIISAFINRKEEKKGADLETEVDLNMLARNNIGLFNVKADVEVYKLFLEKWLKQHPVAVNRATDFLCWRYFQHPVHRYRVWKHGASDEIQSMLIFRMMHVYGLKACVIMDLLCLSDYSAKSLLKTLEMQMKEAGIELIIAASASRNHEYNQLKVAGFMIPPRLLLPQQLPFIIRFHKETQHQELISDLNNWHFTFGDYDVF